MNVGKAPAGLVMPLSTRDEAIKSADAVRQAALKLSNSLAKLIADLKTPGNKTHIDPEQLRMIIDLSTGLAKLAECLDGFTSRCISTREPMSVDCAKFVLFLAMAHALWLDSLDRNKMPQQMTKEQASDYCNFFVMIAELGKRCESYENVPASASYFGRVYEGIVEGTLQKGNIDTLPLYKLDMHYPEVVLHFLQARGGHDKYKQIRALLAPLIVQKKGNDVVTFYLDPLEYLNVNLADLVASDAKCVANGGHSKLPSNFTGRPMLSTLVLDVTSADMMKTYQKYKSVRVFGDDAGLGTADEYAKLIRAQAGTDVSAKARIAILPKAWTTLSFLRRLTKKHTVPLFSWLRLFDITKDSEFNPDQFACDYGLDVVLVTHFMVDRATSGHSIRLSLLTNRVTSVFGDSFYGKLLAPEFHNLKHNEQVMKEELGLVQGWATDGHAVADAQVQSPGEMWLSSKPPVAPTAMFATALLREEALAPIPMIRMNVRHILDELMQFMV